MVPFREGEAPLESTRMIAQGEREKEIRVPKGGGCRSLIRPGKEGRGKETSTLPEGGKEGRKKKRAYRLPNVIREGGGKKEDITQPEKKKKGDAKGKGRGGVLWLRGEKKNPLPARGGNFKKEPGNVVFVGERGKKAHAGEERQTCKEEARR